MRSVMVSKELELHDSRHGADQVMVYCLITLP